MCVVPDEAMASVYLDNKLVKQTDWKPVSQQCWDLKFSLDLDRVCSLLFNTYYYDFFDMVFERWSMQTFVAKCPS